MKLLVGTLLGAFCVQTLLALDFGADYPVLPPQPNGQGFYAGLAEQYTYFGDTQLDGNHVFNQNGEMVPVQQQHLNTLTSEPFFGYNFNDRIGLRLELPVIYREFEAVLPFGNAVTSFSRIHGTEWGMGDIRLIANAALIKKETPDCTLNWNLSAGIKFPTGDSSALAHPQQLASARTNSGPPIIGSTVSGLNGSDLALGSGSYDGLVGTDILLRHDRLFLTTDAQYAIRSEGDFNYQYANDVSWYGGPGVYVLSKDDYSLSTQLIVSGDTKGKDTVRDNTLPNTSETGVYLGPQINFTWRDQLVAQLGADIPVSIETDAVQIVPTYRIHASATWRF